MRSPVDDPSKFLALSPLSLLVARLIILLPLQLETNGLMMKQDPIVPNAKITIYSWPNRECGYLQEEKEI